MLCHYTLDTGILAEVPQPEDLAILAEQLTAGDHAMPNFPGYVVRSAIEGLTLAATVYRSTVQGPMPLVTAYVCLDEDGLVRVLKLTGSKPVRPLWLPACVVQVHPTIALGDAPFLGDWERGLAWAWVERMG